MKKNRPFAGRIVFLSASAGVWGAEESLLTLAKALKQSGYDVTLVCFAGTLADRWMADLASEPLIAGQRENPDSTKLASALTLWSKYLKSASRGDRVVLFTYYLAALAPLARILLLPHGASIILDMHDNLPGRKGRALLQFSSTFVQTIIAVSEYTAGQFGPHRARVTVLTRPVEHQEGPALSHELTRTLTSAPTRIGIVGRLVKGKGHPLLLKAASMIDGNFAVVVRGSGDGSADDTEADVVADGRALLGARFVFEGSVPRERVMHDLDVLVVANEREPMGRTVIEAQLSGVVAVVPNAGGSSELVKDGITGYKYLAGDAGSLAQTLKSVVTDADRRHAIATSARAEAVVSASPQLYARSYAEAIGS